MRNKVLALRHGCPCGAEHPLLTEVCEIRENAAQAMADYLETHRLFRVTVVCDENTEPYAKALANALGEESHPLRLSLAVLPANAHATEVYSARAEAFFTDCDTAVACGSGSIHDIVRYAAHRRGIPFLSYPTAASVDGFVSGVAAMTWHGQKLTFPSTPPAAVFADPGVFSRAPARLTASGIGDVYGKFTSLLDWQVGAILTGEHLCPSIAALEYEALSSVTAVIQARETVSVEEYSTKVMEALLLSGLAMQLMGNSRPASGAEHHLSHLWEMNRLNGETDALHGEKVAVGLLCVVKKYTEWLKNRTSLSPFPDDVLARYFDPERLRPVFRELTEGIVRENLPGGVSSLSKIRTGGEAAVAQIKKAFGAIPPYEELKALLLQADVPTTFDDISIQPVLPPGADFTKLSLRFAPFVRDRITLLKVISACEEEGI